MSNVAVYTALREYLEANWDSNLAPLTWENERSNPSAGSPFVYVQLDDSDFEQISFGTGEISRNLWRRVGGVLILIAVPIDTGTRDADNLLETMMSLLQGLILPPDDEGREVIFDAMRTVGRGRTSDAGEGIWYGIWLSIGWTKDF